MAEIAIDQDRKVEETEWANILPIPAKDRMYTFWKVAPVWFAAIVVMSTPMTGGGGVLTPNVLWAVPIVFVSLVAFIPHTLMSSITQKFGITCFVASRRAFGIRGTIIGSASQVLQLVGWNALMLVVGANGADSVFRQLGLPTNWAFWVLLIEAVMVIVVLMGPVGLGRYSLLGTIAIVLLGLTVSYALLTGPIQWNQVLAPNPNPTMSYVGFFELAVAYNLGWLPMMGDYARYTRTRKAAIWGGLFGLAVGASWFILIGVFSTAATGNYDPSDFIARYGFGIPSIALLLAGITTTNAVCLYSTVVACVNVFPKPKHLGKGFIWTLAGVLSAIMLALAFVPDILNYFINFVFIIGVLLASYFGPVLADFLFTRRGGDWEFDLSAAFGVKGPYWYNWGVNWRGIVPLAIGFAVNEYLVLNQMYFLWFGVALPVLVATGLLYVGLNYLFPPEWLKERRKVAVAPS